MCDNSARRRTGSPPRPPCLCAACQSVWSRKSPIRWETMKTAKTSVQCTEAPYRYPRPMIGESVPAEPGAGDLLGAYTIDAPISRGAMGAVYSARTGDGDQVAIKRLMDLRQAARFEIEARLLARLQHPRIARVLDHFQDERGSYLVMELVRGSDLGEVLVERGGTGLPADEAVEYAIQACEALQYVHDEQVLHRD